MRATKNHHLAFVLITTFLNPVAFSQHEMHHARPGDAAEPASHAHSMGPAGCTEMEVWNYSTGMCAPLPDPDMKMWHVMVHGNAFLAGIAAEKPRGANKIASPNMLMVDAGRTVGNSHYLNLNLMLTAEKWTVPSRGYPELLQVGEEDSEHRPYIDAQHPHSSPIMGITLSDTIKLAGAKNYLQLFFAPRGQPVEGPTAFMHRTTGMVNPDAPLGHHVGQDSGHITSTVVGASLKISDVQVEASAFHGEEPSPDEVDLPVATPDSVAGRLIYNFSDSLQAMASLSYVQSPEAHDPDLNQITRYSASVYNHHDLGGHWMFHNSFIFGGVRDYDHADNLFSFGEEFLIHGERPKFWGRLEVLQRTPAQLFIASPDPDEAKWVAALTLGYTHVLWKNSDLELGLGASVTNSFLPAEFEGAYGTRNPWSGKVFLQLSGMKMWML